MLKVRLMGEKKEIRWFLKVLGRNPKVQVENTSTFFSNKNTSRYKRVYTQINRVDSKKGCKKEKPELGSSVKNSYCGSGKTFC